MSDEQGIPGHAFISYVREDHESADRLQRILEAAGVRVWRDTASLWPGQDWRVMIRRAITQDALVFIACFSNNSVNRNKNYQNEELALAIEQLRQRQPDASWLIPVRFDDCVIPEWEIGSTRTLASIQRADLFGDGGYEAIARLLSAVLNILNRRPDAKLTPPGLPVPSTTDIESEREHPAAPETERTDHVDASSGVASSGHARASLPPRQAGAMTEPRLLGDRYELGGVVGRGDRAEVYRARDLRLDRIVAVKALREDLARDPTLQARFRRGAQSAASLNHPSIVAVHDFGEDGTGIARIPFMVMEYVDGRTIRDLLRDDRRLLPERALEITDGVLCALHCIHNSGLVHRDIKPAHVMLNRQGEIKVMGFGTARAVSDAQATMTQKAPMIGTVQYMSPEQVTGDPPDSRSDLYSAGCMLYELLTGWPPFTGDSPSVVADRQVSDKPRPPSRADPTLPTWADPITLRAMAKDRGDRYQTAAEMRTDIQRALSGYTVAARPRQQATNQKPRSFPRR